MMPAKPMAAASYKAIIIPARSCITIGMLAGVTLMLTIDIIAYITCLTIEHIFFKSSLPELSHTPASPGYPAS